MIPVYAERFGVKTISHGLEGFTAPRLAEMEGAGVVHYGGHGYPDRVVDSLNGPYARRIRWAPCVFFNGACYCGVVHGWFDTSSGRAKKKTVPATASFCLNLLSSEVLGYLASLHPDHGIPVYQEMEFLAWSGAPLGEVIKHTHDGVVLGAGGRLPALTALADGAKPPFGSPAEVMLWGTASRVLYGDPAMRPLEAFTAEPFEVSSRLNGRTLAVRAVLKNPALKSTFTETYHSDLSATGQFNDRALVSCDLPGDVAGAKVIAGLRAEAGGAELKCRLVGFGVEADDGRRRLHALVDLPSTGYQQGPFRAAGAALSFEAEME